MKLEGMLPVGSVVLIGDNTKRLMIIGFLQQEAETENVWDYVGIPYPEGYMGSERTYLFNHSQITRVFSIGYQDDEQFAFSVQLEKAAEELRKQSEGTRPDE